MSLFSIVFLEAKKKFDTYGKTAIPALVVFTWIFIYMPFAGIIPSAIIYLSSDWDDVVLQVTYERITAGFIAILLMLGVALTTIVIHLYFKRRDFEKRFKYSQFCLIRRFEKFCMWSRGVSGVLGGISEGRQKLWYEAPLTVCSQ